MGAVDGKRAEGREEMDGQWGSYLEGSEYWKVPRECECVFFFFLLSGADRREGNPLKLHLPLFFLHQVSVKHSFHFLLAVFLGCFGVFFFCGATSLLNTQTQKRSGNPRKFR